MIMVHNAHAQRQWGRVRRLFAISRSHPVPTRGYPISAQVNLINH